MNGFALSHSNVSALARLRGSITTSQYIVGGLAFFSAAVLYDYSSWRRIGMRLLPLHISMK